MKKIIICSLMTLGQFALLTAGESAFEQNKKQVEAYIEQHPEKAQLGYAAIALGKPIDEVENLANISMNDVANVDRLERDGKISYSAKLTSGDTICVNEQGKYERTIMRAISSEQGVVQTDEYGEEFLKIKETTKSYPVFVPLKPNVATLLQKVYNKKGKTHK